MSPDIMDILSADLKKNLILSIGTPDKFRTLSPVEVGEGFAIAKKAGMTNSKIAEMVLLKDTTMINRFIKLLDLSENIRHLVGWGETASTLSFSSATEIAKLQVNVQDELAKSALENTLTKLEIIQVIQLLKRSRKDVITCVEEVLKMRTIVTRKYIFMGALTDDEVKKKLSTCTQKTRDILMRGCLAELLGDEKVEAKLGIKQFTLIGNDALNNRLNRMEPNFEVVINSAIKMRLKNVFPAC